MRDTTPAEIEAREIATSSTEKALFLVPSRPGAKPGFVPRSVATQGEGPRARFFTMPRFVAVERGWL